MHNGMASFQFKIISCLRRFANVLYTEPSILDRECKFTSTTLRLLSRFWTALIRLSYSNILLKFLNKAPLKNPGNLRNLSLNLKTGQ